LGLLKNRDLDGVVKWVSSSRTALRTINALTYEQDDLICWRAIEAIGRAAACKSLPEARDLVRRQFWSMTEESGGCAWRAPEVIGEILANKPELIKEFGVILSSFFKEEPFEQGAHFAVAHTANLDKATYENITEELLLSLHEEDPFNRLHAVIALLATSKLGAADQELIEKLRTDQTGVAVYDFEAGGFKDRSTADIFEEIEI